MVTFGQGDADYQMKAALIEGTRTTVEFAHGDWSMSFAVGAPGGHIAMNAVAAMATVIAAGAEPGAAAMALCTWTPPDGRGGRVQINLPGGGEILLLDESYNANPTSVQAALAVLAATGRVPRRRHAFLGDMLELGPEEIAFHQGLATLPEIAEIGQVHCCGPLMAALYDNLPPDLRGICTTDSVALAERVRSVLEPGDVCMVKGSLGARMAVVVDSIKALGTVGPATDKDD